MAAAAPLELAQAVLSGVERCKLSTRVSPYLGVVAVAKPTGHSVTFAAITAGDEAALLWATFCAAHTASPGSDASSVVTAGTERATSRRWF